jgi:hypothetical protein
VATVGLSGCGTAPGGGGAGARSSDVITRAEIEGSASDSAYEAVERLRRDWLVSRGPTSATDPTPVLPKVFVDGLERGELQALYAISANVIEEIRFIGSSEATLLHGQGYLGGIIQLQHPCTGSTSVSNALDCSTTPNNLWSPPGRRQRSAREGVFHGASVRAIRQQGGAQAW